MTNYVEYNDKIAFHPGYYIKEIVENLGITQEDFAKRLDTTPKNISLIIRGEQRLSTDMAMKLSNMLGTSVNYWLNLQNAYDAALAEIEAVEELEKDKTILRLLGYDYFEQHFNLPHLPRQLELQVKELRKFLGVANLQVLQGRDFAVNFRGNTTSMDRANIIKANAMVQIATNMALQTKAPKFNKVKFEDAVEKAGIKGKIAGLSNAEDTIIHRDFDDNGYEPSGGEVQKIALARAIYKDGSLFILDEPTASMDPRAEYELYSHFNYVTKDRTVIFISHRLSSTRFCDKVALFSGGSILEIGTHKELMESNHYYKELYMMQAQYYRD